jgi:hypothetical protein
VTAWEAASNRAIFASSCSRWVAFDPLLDLHIALSSGSDIWCIVSHLASSGTFLGGERIANSAVLISARSNVSLSSSVSEAGIAGQALPIGNAALHSGLSRVLRPSRLVGLSAPRSKPICIKASSKDHRMSDNRLTSLPTFAPCMSVPGTNLLCHLRDYRRTRV